MTPIESMLQERRSYPDCQNDRLLAVRSELREVPEWKDEGGLILEHCQCCQDDILPERETGETSVGIADSNVIHFAAFTFGTDPDTADPGEMLPTCKRDLQAAHQLADKQALEYALRVVGELKASQWPEFRDGLVGLGFLRKEER